MKKIVTGIVALALASSVFAVDFSAKVKMTGNIADGTVGNKTETELLKLTSSDQKDADALIMSVSGDQAGAAFQFWYNYAGGDSDLKVRNANIWFKPIDMLKITVGNVSVGTYKEMINWWKCPTGTSATQYGAWDHRYSSYATVEGAGANVEVTPIDGLWVSAGIAPGTDTASIKINNDFSYAAYGVAAKYDLNGLLGLPMTTAASWRDEGKGGVKIAAIGFDYGAAFGEGFYGFLNTRFYFDKTSYKYVKNTTITDKVSSKTETLQADFDAIGLSGICFDNYEKFSAGALKVQTRFPVTIRGLRQSKEYNTKLAALGFGIADVDPCYFSFAVKAEYSLDGFTPYIYVGNENAITFNKDFFEQLKQCEIKPGLTMNVGSCAIDLGLDVVIPATGKDLSWSVPFELGVSF